MVNIRAGTLLKQRYTELGYVLSNEELEQAYRSFCTIADQKKDIFDEDLIAIVEDRESSADDFYHLENIQVFSGTNLRPTATVEFACGMNGSLTPRPETVRSMRRTKRLRRITGVIGKLTEYSIKSVTFGS